MKKNAAYMSVKDFAKEYDFSPKTIRNQITKGLIPTIRVGKSIRIDMSKADAFIICKPVSATMTDLPTAADEGRLLHMKHKIRKPLESSGVISYSLGRDGTQRWYLRKFPLCYKNKEGEIEYAKHAGFATRKEAEDFKEECIAKRKKIVRLTGEKGTSVYIRFKKYIELYGFPKWESQGQKDMMTSWIEKHLKPEFMDIEVTEVTSDDFQEFFLKQNRERRISEQVSLMRELFQKLYDDHVIQTNVMSHVKIPTHKVLTKQNREVLTEDEEQRFYRELMTSNLESVKRYRHGILLMMWSGCRPGEICGGEWKNIDFANNTFFIKRTFRKDGTTSALKETTKTGKSGERRAHFDESCIPYLKEAMHRCSTGWIMENPNKKPLGVDRLRKIVKTIAKAAGIKRSVYPYLFRHMFATKLLDEKMGYKEVAALMGHKNARMVIKTYGNHVKNDIIENNLDKLAVLVPKDTDIKSNPEK